MEPARTLEQVGPHWDASDPDRFTLHETPFSNPEETESRSHQASVCAYCDNERHAAQALACNQRVYDELRRLGETP